ncbi:MAG: hypothetical protein E2O39_01425 [Planctomycetota bacterium]|nr:MAG: hypothetical protein E2O39_01425 [Planctomycetota bacterium]
MESIRSALARPEAYAGPPRAVTTLETHISMLFFVDDRVYKVKKDIALPFLDFSTPERRRHFCEEEVRLNRRLAPDVYLGVVPVRRDDAGVIRMGGEGATIDWAVEMVRLPEHRMLASLLDEGEVDNEQMNALAELLVAFHGDATRGPSIDRFGSPGAIAAIVLENFAETREFADPASPLWTVSRRMHSFLEDRARAALGEHRTLFTRRVREGRICEGHGDLHAGNLCYMVDGIVAYDCIEFDERFRHGDVACDLAFLAMDLDRRGYPAFAAFLVRRYGELAGDPDLARIVNFYKGYRAMVRAKVASMSARGSEPGGERREAARREAMSYFQLAASYELPPVLVLMCGLPASGKSFLARRLARPLRAAVLRSDVRRKQIAGLPLHEHRAAAFGAGPYTAEMSRSTYDSLLEAAGRHLAHGRSVVIDAAFARRTERQRFAATAHGIGAPCILVEAAASEAVTRERMRRRAAGEREVSDADFTVYLGAQKRFEPPLEVQPDDRFRFESPTDTVEELAQALFDRRIEAEQLRQGRVIRKDSMNATPIRWVLAADRTRARLLQCTRTSHGRIHLEDQAELLEHWEELQHGRPSPRSGREGHNSASLGHESDERLRRFAKEVATWTGLQVAEHGIEQLELFTSTRFLGELRKVAGGTVRAVTVEHDADIAHLSIPQLVKEIERHLEFPAEKSSAPSK